MNIEPGHIQTGFFILIGIFVLLGVVDLLSSIGGLARMLRDWMRRKW